VNRPPLDGDVVVALQVRIHQLDSEDAAVVADDRALDQQFEPGQEPGVVDEQALFAAGPGCNVAKAIEQAEHVVAFECLGLLLGSSAGGEDVPAALDLDGLMFVHSQGHLQRENCLARDPGPAGGISQKAEPARRRQRASGHAPRSAQHRPPRSGWPSDGP
jgi:hypothetical protein